jgi:hypothetical protein
MDAEIPVNSKREIEKALSSTVKGLGFSTNQVTSFTKIRMTNKAKPVYHLDFSPSGTNGRNYRFEFGTYTGGIRINVRVEKMIYLDVNYLKSAEDIEYVLRRILSKIILPWEAPEPPQVLKQLAFSLNAVFGQYCEVILEEESLGHKVKISSRRDPDRFLGARVLANGVLLIESEFSELRRLNDVFSPAGFEFVQAELNPIELGALYCLHVFDWVPFYLFEKDDVAIRRDFLKKIKMPFKQIPYGKRYNSNLGSHPRH